MDQANLNLGLFQETKVMDGIHMRASVGYCIFTTNAMSRNIIGVAVFYRYEAPHFQVEAIHQHGTNVLSFQLASGGRRWFIVGF